MKQFIGFWKNRKEIPFSETPEDGKIDKDYFLRMMSPKALRISKEFDLEEKTCVENTLVNLQDFQQMNFVVIGSGPLSLLKSVYGKAKSYVAIEPLIELYIPEHLLFLVKKMKDIFIINKKFYEVSVKDLPEGNTVFVFLFNIIAYIDNPVKHINELLRPGDIIYISTWNRTEKANKLRKKYFDYLNSFEENIIIDPELTIGFCNLDYVPFNRINFYKKHSRIRGDITDILIIYT